MPTPPTENSETSETATRAVRRRDSSATKELILAAATTEFAEYGFAGARIERIAERAGANKRLLYVYFGDKEKLFEAVLERQTAELTQAVPLPDGDLVAFAGARFDYMLAHPEAARLSAWRRFERVQPSEVEGRTYQERVDVVAAAQREGRLDATFPAVDLFAMVLRITESWLDAPPALMATVGEAPMSPERLQEHRAALIEAVRRVTLPREAL
ncbi:TetR/AcrR family transcriptional regulator [Streptomyces sp. TP-A0356]|uniref:TetR/AcrR family transcriptional regulator n=1 Tax=Streptomyces sp. TP-A0356 TaxID=1359208 RepID=UPI00099E6322|nr:TetR family transcriptional regulator [Streptomyces sp. TP-A0356]